MPKDAPARELVAEAERREVRRNWLLCSPAMLWLVLFSSGPLLIVLAYSVLKPAEYGGVVWQPSGEAWFKVLFQRDIFSGEVSLAWAHLEILLRSLTISLFTTLVTLAVGFPTAYFIATRPAHTRNIWLFLITIPFWTNLLIRTFAILEVIRNEGLVNTALIKLGLIDQPVQMVYTDFAIMLGMTYVYLPLMVLPLYAAMERLDFRLVEAAYDLYATRLQVLRRVIIPIVRPGIVAGSILVFIPSLGVYVTPRVLGGGTHMMLANLIDLQFGAGRNFPLGAALSITLLALVLVALIVYVRVTQRATEAGR